MQNANSSESTPGPLPQADVDEFMKDVVAGPGPLPQADVDEFMKDVVDVERLRRDATL